MNQILPVALAGAADAAAPQQTSDTSTAATNAFGLQFDSLLKIILAQLTYQDPLKPMDNFEFVSQLAQFSQIQQGQTANERLEALVNAQATSRVTGLLGRDVDIAVDGGLLSGKVMSVDFESGVTTIKVKTADGATISKISPASITSIK